MINQVQLNQTTQTLKKSSFESTATDGKNSTSITSKELSYTETSDAAIYEASEPEASPEKAATYTVDFEKVLAMKEETDLRMLELFKDTSKNTGLKQLGGIRGILDKIRNGEKVTLEIEYTEKDVEQAKIDVAEGGYWSAEETSNRLLDFAKALSGSDPAKANMLKDAFIKGFEEIKEMFGGELPQLSEDTYDLTISKFDEWAKGDSI